MGSLGKMIMSIVTGKVAEEKEMSEVKSDFLRIKTTMQRLGYHIPTPTNAIKELNDLDNMTPRWDY